MKSVPQEIQAELASLNQQIDRSYDDLNTQISDRVRVLTEAAKSLDTMLLHREIFSIHRTHIALSSMNYYLKDYAADAFYLTSHQCLKAKRDVLQAYEVIQAIIKNPTAPIDEQKLAILQVDSSVRWLVAGIVGSLAFITMIMLIPLLIGPTATLPVILSFAFGASFGTMGSMMLSVLSGIQVGENATFCDTILNKTPTFFGKGQTPEVAEQTGPADGTNPKFEGRDAPTTACNLSN